LAIEAGLGRLFSASYNGFCSSGLTIRRRVIHEW
jgi:hypothetical protein